MLRQLTYEARDGKKIRGFITIPNSKPPYPLVVMPHGGPFVGENPSFDEWAQMLANRGFMVLQPQYRGSQITLVLIFIKPHLSMEVKVAIKCRMIKMMVLFIWLKKDW